MLLDSGSELNIITQELQEGLRLPMDPLGANWTLRGVSGHPVHLVGVCRNVPVDVGGMGFNHHFFVTQDKIGEKGMIGGQPWLFNHAARINYIIGKCHNYKCGKTATETIHLFEYLSRLSSPSETFTKRPCDTHAKSRQRRFHYNLMN